MKTMDRKGNKIKRPLTRFVAKNNREILEKCKYIRIAMSIKGKRRRGVIDMKNVLNYDEMTSGQRSAQALRILKKGFHEDKMSENDPIIRDILERTKTYAK